MVRLLESGQRIQAGQYGSCSDSFLLLPSAVSLLLSGSGEDVRAPLAGRLFTSLRCQHGHSCSFLYGRLRSISCSDDESSPDGKIGCKASIDLTLRLFSQNGELRVQLFSFNVRRRSRYDVSGNASQNLRLVRCPERATLPPRQSHSLADFNPLTRARFLLKPFFGGSHPHIHAVHNFITA